MQETVSVCVEKLRVGTFSRTVEELRGESLRSCVSVTTDDPDAL